MKRIPSGLRSLNNRLALLFFAVTALSLAVVTFVFLPQLETKIENQKLKDLEQVARSSVPRLEAVIGQDVTGPEIDDIVRTISDRTNARVTLLGLQQNAGRPTANFYVITDSNQAPPVSPDYQLAAQALKLRPTSPPLGARVHTSGVVAEPLYYAGSPTWVALFTRKFDDAHQAVHLVRNRLLLASGVALIVAMLGGWLVARRIARRVRRLERAARSVAAGHRVEPLPVESDDELGRLTRAFNEMQEQLAQVERARRDFIANASHELRTPIFSLGGFVELLQDEQLDAATREEFLATMGEQVARLQKLAVDLLDLSKIDAGSLDLNPEKVDLAELAGAVAAELSLSLPEGSVDAVCDRERVSQIMRILLDNALRHTPEGTPVTVMASRSNGAAELSVADKGPGLAPATRGHAFERFFTADAARGSGLGLAIAKELTEQMHGRITLHSRPGRTIFKIALPAPDEDGSA